MVQATTDDAVPQTTEPPSPPKLQFPTPFTFILNNPVPLVELRLRRFAREIHAKPRWWEKVNDVDIVARWRSEIIDFDNEMIQRFWAGDARFDEGSGEKQWPRDSVTEAQLNHLFDQLRYVARQRDQKTGTTPTTIPMVYEAPSLIPSSLKSGIRELANMLENVPDDQKDWHPGSKSQVLDLVHPSLFCLRIRHSFVHDPQPGHTDVLRRLTEEEYFHQRPDIEKRARDVWTRQPTDGRLPFDFTVSKAYQWLPTDFAITADGRVTPKGYINNLHPVDYAVGYQTIPSILERFVPLFERTLSDQLSPPPPPIFPIEPQMWYSREYDSRPEELEHGEMEAWERLNHWPDIPDALPFQPPSEEGRVSFSLKGRTIQVIVKMANIVLTPELPTYDGGSWHVEGMANEKIVATGLYYYDSDNITESKLMFRAAVGDGECNGATFLDYEQWDHKGYLVVYGITNEQALNQQLGHIVAQEDKCIVFPNIYQHRVAPFELADKSRPGHRKILAFFLVDPLTPIHSTSVIPPQQAHWYRDLIYSAKPFQKLPVELVETILLYALEGAITVEEAMEDREELMQERAQFIVEHNSEVFEAPFAMCEH
ncbi:hypothetical protein GY45DRAFT_1288418 [Cubamyces sp. BRFM 1775]|nr:hypothetical protein GY45DRAFT_1288418 [Cubamyces sp. BRFM 1775]